MRASRSATHAAGRRRSLHTTPASASSTTPCFMASSLLGRIGPPSVRAGRLPSERRWALLPGHGGIDIEAAGGSACGHHGQLAAGGHRGAAPGRCGGRGVAARTSGWFPHAGVERLGAVGSGPAERGVDLRLDDDRDRARALIARSDVFVDAWSPGVAAGLGLAADDLCADNPRLVHVRISAFGDHTRFAAAEGWEAAVMAAMGGPESFSSVTSRPGPAFVSTPYASVAAAHLAIQGALGAVVERERSGRGQQVEVTLARALVAYDTWNWLVHVLTERYSGAFTAGTAIDAENLIPNTPMFFRLLVGLSKDGRWLQFSQTTDRLWHAFLRSCDLDPDDPALLAMENAEDPDDRVRFWELLLAAVRRRTAAEWASVFDADPNVWADLYRGGPGDARARATGGRRPGGLQRLGHTRARRLGPGSRLVGRSLGPTARARCPRRRPRRPCCRGARRPPRRASRACRGARRPTARRHHHRGDRLVLRRAVRGDAARRAGRPGDQGGDRRWATPSATSCRSRSCRASRCCRARSRSVSTSPTPEGHATLLELVRRADVVLQTFRGRGDRPPRVPDRTT